MSRWTEEKRLNAELAERMFGWKWVWAETDVPGVKRIALVSPEQMREAEHYKRPYQLADTQSVEKIPSKSLWSARWADDLRSSMQVVEEMVSRGYSVKLEFNDPVGGSVCRITGPIGNIECAIYLALAPAGMMAHAICEAALKALKKEDPL